MNNDLISREALKEAFEEAHTNFELTFDINTYGDVINIIDNAPTVDINTKLSIAYLKGRRQGQSEERPQGEWIRTGSIGNGNAHYECSNCHYGDEHAESQEVPYCWHCGAKMKGGAEE